MTVRDGDCMLWTGALTATGAGHFFESTARGIVLAHRFAFEKKFGPIPKGKVVKQTCGNNACVADAHLKLVPRALITVSGSEGPRVKLTDDQVRAIREDKRVMRVIGADYGLTATAVWHIKHRKAWGHVA